MTNELLHSRKFNTRHFISTQVAIKGAVGQSSTAYSALIVSNKTPYKVSESSNIQDLKAITLQPLIRRICEESIF
jgi:carbonic anhydrase/acetyltransferase-like protein (isoleucine patch superfamily)